MVKRSLHASLPGIQRAKRAFGIKGWTQENLAGEVNLKTRQPIWRFFTGQPVDRQIFLEICSILDLDWRDIALDPPALFPEPGDTLKGAALDLDALVRKVRSQRRDKIQDRCGILQLLNINHPVNIDDIYVDANILAEIPSQQWLEIAEVQLSPYQERLGMDAIEPKRIPAIQALESYSKLRVLGKPGIGKTTFLQHLAIQCNRGILAKDKVPIFISLKDFAQESRQRSEFSLFHYIRREFVSSGVTDRAVLTKLLQGGRVLLLLDGMDEVPSQDINAVIQEIRKLSDKYYKNQLITSCRTAPQKLGLRGFTDVEIAPSTQAQIATFAGKWFVTLSKNSDRAAEFLQKLELPENWQFRQLMAIPLFLHLACCLFHGQETFPTSRSEFYKQGLDLLLGKWDEARGVERDEAYPGFLVPQKLKLLSHLAAIACERGQYILDRRVIEQYIADYLRNLPDVSLEPEELQLESLAILKAIEAQHGLLIERARGIFSFSYLAFQDYLMARQIVASNNREVLERSLKDLVTHIADSHWREVFLLTAAMLRSAEPLVKLMKQEIDALVAQDSYLQEFLHARSREKERACDRHIRSWQFTPEQQQTLQRYDDGDRLLVDCLNGS